VAAPWPMDSLNTNNLIGDIVIDDQAIG
jgi:hypothetical protein